MLRTNYRNAAPILEAALGMIRDDPFDDLDGPAPNGRRDVDLTYHDGKVVRERARSDHDHDRRLVEALHAQTTLADTALLCPTLRQTDEYQRLLSRSGIPVIRLEHYDGRPVEAVKLGTYRRAKGLEFKNVYLPHHDRLILKGGDTDSDRERAEIARRQLFVAMCRARDLLWLGSAGQSD